MSKTDILGVKLDNVGRAQALERVLGFLGGEGYNAVFTPNPEMVMRARRDPSFRKVLNGGDLVVADGVGVVLASHLLGGGLAERVAGMDLVQDVLAHKKGLKVFLLGAKPGVAQAAAENLALSYGVEVVGHRHGYFANDEEEDVAAQVRAAAPDLLLVGLGSPRQEIFIDSHRLRLGARVAIGCGGSIDVFAGVARRAPLWAQKSGLEWAHRLATQPTRLPRMVSLPHFALCVLADGIRVRK